MNQRLRKMTALLACALPACVLPAAAHADDAAPRCTYVDIADVPIHYAGLNLSPAVDGVINGSQATMLVDTGAFDTQLTMNGAMRHDLGMFMTGRYAEGFSGYSRLYSARLKELAIGPAHTDHRVELLVIAEDNTSPSFDAIVGAPFLLQTDLEFDLHAKQIRFFRQRDCDNTALMLWKEPTVIVPFVRTRDRSPNPHITVLVNGKEVDAVVDTGNQHTVMTLDAAKRIGIDVNGPGAQRLGEYIGVGSDRVPHWEARTKTIAIGDEVINNAEIGIIDSHGRMSTELYLGQDFLRAHRVLFAMSQKKLYIAYLGGDAFARTGGVQDWMRSEAEGGNPDAQFSLAAAYNNGRGVTRDRAQAQAWLQKAAAAGQPNANLSLGREQMLAGQFSDAIPKLRSALDQLPANRLGPLWLYVARVRNGESELAKTELQANLKRQREDDWPRPIADFYLGKLDAAHLLAEAGKDKASAHARTCMADSYMAEWYAAQNQREQADALKATVRTECRAAAAPASRPAADPAPSPAAAAP